MATLYCGPSNTGNGSGSNFSNLLALPDTTGFTRGNTYIVVDGSYGSRTISTAVSGTSRIIIKKASTADSGVVGYSSTLHDGQAIFSGLSPQRGYITVDGVTGGGPGAWTTGLGIKVTSTTEIGQWAFPPAYTTYDTILQHIDFDLGQTGPTAVRGIEFGGCDGITIRYSYIHDIGADTYSGIYCNNITTEYSKIARNHQDAAFHGDGFEYQVQDASNFTFRYNLFEDTVGSYGFGSHGPTINGYYVYGNIFYFTTSCFFGNGMIGVLSGGGTLTNFKFYNNTIAGVIGDGGYGYGFGLLRGTGNEARNTLIYRLSGTQTHAWPPTISGNTAYNMGAVADQNLTGNPFANFPTSFALAADSTAGTSLSSPYNVDMLGNAYSAAGGWTRGAIAFGSGGSPPVGTIILSVR